MLCCAVKVHVGAECGGTRHGAGGGCDDGVASGRDEALGVCLVIDTDLAFVAMCLAAACGHPDVVEILGNAGRSAKR